MVQSLARPGASSGICAACWSGQLSAGRAGCDLLVPNTVFLSGHEEPGGMT